MWDLRLSQWCEDSGLLECGSLWLGRWFPLLYRNIVPLSARVMQLMRSGPVPFSHVSYSWTAWQSETFLSKCWGQFAHWHSITSQKTWILKFYSVVRKFNDCIVLTTRSQDNCSHHYSGVVRNELTYLYFLHMPSWHALEQLYFVGSNYEQWRRG
jgi:hypothetical protein